MRSKSASGFESGAQGAADFVQDVQLFAAPRSLLNQIAIFDGHADLVAQGEEQAQFGRSEIAIVRRAQQQDAEDAILGLQTDTDHGAQALAEQHFAHVAEGFFFFQREPIGVTSQIAQDDQAAQARDELHDVIIEIIFLHGTQKESSRPVTTTDAGPCSSP